MSPLAHIAALPIRAYRLIFSPWVGFNCRYQPTCSAYILEALEQHGGIKGTYLGVRRVCRCHPFAASGYDPVPPAAGNDPNKNTAKDSVKASGCDCNHDRRP